MLTSDLIGLLEFLANLIGLPLLSVLISLFILALELFVIGIILLFAVRRIRKEIIDMNRKIDVLVQPQQEESKKEFKEEFGKISENGPENDSEKQPDDALNKKKYRYKWK